MSALEMSLLGTLEICRDGRSLLKPPTVKSQSLLAYLVLHRQHPQPRERLADLFWGDRPERKARGSLSTALWHVRRCLPEEEFILSDVRAVQFDPEVDLWLDVNEFEANLGRDDVTNLEAAVALYRGEFLEDFYDDWILNERYRLEGLFAEALERLMRLQEAQQQYASALSTAQRLLEHDSLREDAYRLAMRVYCHLGQRNRAVELYHRCQATIKQDLGVEPMDRTRELYEAILNGRFEAAPAPEMVPAWIPAQPRIVVGRGRSPLDLVASSPLVGREGELAALYRSWGEAKKGQGHLVLMLGEAGIGKTRLVEELANHVRWEGARVLTGRCYRFENNLPYQPVAEILRVILLSLGPGEMQALPAWAIAEAIALVPGIADQLPEMEEATPGAPTQEQARLFEGVARLLTGLSSHDPYLIVVEDLHWASEPTLQILHYLVRHLAGQPVLLAGTVRPEEIGPRHPLGPWQQHLIQEGLAQSISLPPLSAQAVETYLTEVSGAGEAVIPLARRLAQETEGNPFFLNEIVKALFEKEMIRLEGGAWQGDFQKLSERDLPLPASVSAAIEARAHDLDDPAQEALRLAAVLGREFDLDVLSGTCGEDNETALEALEVLLRRRLIEETTADAARDYTFTHQKIQEVIYDSTPRRHRQYAHARAGLVMEQIYGPQVEESAGEVAFHFEQGRMHDPTLTGKAIDYLLRAGDQSRRLYAHGDAIDFYQRALSLQKERRDYDQAARTLMKLGLTHHTAFDFQRARQAYDEGFALWQRRGRTQPPSPAVPQTLRLAHAEPTSLDPALVSDFSSLAVLDQLFSGLVERTPDLDIIPNLARAWEVLEGGRRYIFHLRDNARWSDGTPVVAEDFCYAWQRVLDPEVGSPGASLLYDIKGARDLHLGQVSDPGLVGVRAPDPATLIIELEEPAGCFLQVLACNAAYPVPRHMVQKHGPAWTDEVNLVTNGPFQLEGWKKGEWLRLAQNRAWHGSPTGNVQRVDLSFSVEPSTQLQQYEADELELLDMQFFGPVELDTVRALHAGEYVTFPQPFTSYVGFTASLSPFDDPRVRRAFVLATDRETLAEVIMKGFVSPAVGGLIPPGIPGHAPRIGLAYDPAEARRLLAEAGYPDGQGFPAVELLVHTDPASSVASPILQSQWQENLGVTVRWQAEEWAVYLERMNSRPPNLFLWAWVADYPDPDNILRVCPFRDQTRWRNETYEGLVEQARHAMDQEERLRLYRQADRMLIEEAALLPLVYYRSHLLVKPWVSRVPSSPMAYWYWKDTVINAH